MSSLNPSKENCSSLNILARLNNLARAARQKSPVRLRVYSSFSITRFYYQLIRLNLARIFLSQHYRLKISVGNNLPIIRRCRRNRFVTFNPFDNQFSNLFAGTHQDGRIFVHRVAAAAVGAIVVRRKF